MRTHVDYWVHLASIEWEALRREAMRRAGFRCERQRPGDPPHPGPFELHHLHYDTVGFETLEDVELLCQSCHRTEHAPRNRQKRLFEAYGQQRLFDRWIEPREFEAMLSPKADDLDDAA